MYIKCGSRTDLEQENHGPHRLPEHQSHDKISLIGSQYKVSGQCSIVHVDPV